MRMLAALIAVAALAGLDVRELCAQDIPENLLRKALERFDENGNGEWDADELVKAKAAWEERMRAFGVQAGGNKNAGDADDAKSVPLAKPTEAEMLANYDINGNGRLDPEERLIAEQDWKEKQEAQKKPAAGEKPATPDAPGGEESVADFEKRLLIKYDKNGNGRLDTTERSAASGEIAKWRVEQRLIQQRKAKALRGLTPDQRRLLEMFDDNNNYQLDEDERDLAEQQFSRLRKGGWDAVVALHDRLLDQFDTNKNGELDGREKAPAIQFVIRIAAQIEAARKREAASDKQLRKQGVSKKDIKLRKKLD